MSKALWTAEEDAILRREWVLGGPRAAHQALPHRTRQACRGRGYVLGLLMDAKARSANLSKSATARRQRNVRRNQWATPPIDPDLSIPESWG